MPRGKKDRSWKKPSFSLRSLCLLGNRRIVLALIKLSRCLQIHVASPDLSIFLREKMWSPSLRQFFTFVQICTIFIFVQIKSFPLFSSSVVPDASSHLVKSLEMIFVKLLMPCISNDLGAKMSRRRSPRPKTGKIKSVSSCSPARLRGSRGCV